VAGTITQEDREFVERWEHISPANWGVIKLGPRGDEIQETISGRRTFTITTEERMITEDKIRNPKLNPFINGSFRPIIVPDSVNKTTNPNALSDEEIVNILHASDVAFDEWLKTIDSDGTLKRMVEIAENDDEISLKRFRVLEERMASLREELRITTKDPSLANFLSGQPNLGADGHVTASGASNPRRRSTSGGMSSDYRD